MPGWYNAANFVTGLALLSYNARFSGGRPARTILYQIVIRLRMSIR